MNPLQSRSTVICLMCFLTLIAVNVMAVKSGYFDTSFALVTIVICKDILLGILKHQETSDELNASTTTKVTTPPASETTSTTTTETKP